MLNLKQLERKTVYKAKKKRFSDLANTPTKHTPTNKRPELFLTRKVDRLKKGLRQIRTPVLCHLRRIRYIQAKCAGGTKKFELNKN